ncbi:MAG: chemotaxis-specific protein-glutamate methyltransferase CheB [Candidatus Limnocylindrales bacterium]
MARTRVLVVDDSAFMRRSVGRMLGAVPSLEVVGDASNGEEGLKLARELRPDVITLDVEMDVLDGLAMLERLMLEMPTRVVMLSSKTTENAKLTLDALDRGAIDFVAKPTGPLSIDLAQVGDDLRRKIEAAVTMSETAFGRHCRIAVGNVTRARAEARLAMPGAKPLPGGGPAPVPGDLPALCPAAHRRHMPRTAARRLVVVASSTGGPTALNTLVRGLPSTLGAAVVIVQHMPAGFTTSLAARLDTAGTLRCTEATSEDVLVEDEILVAPGDHHMISSTSGHIRIVRLLPVNGVRPAADVTLQSVAPIWRERLLCVVLTGMGVDARDGARAVKHYGGRVIAQDAATATIYGMPGAVATAGLADQVLPLDQIASAVAAWCAADEQESPRPKPVRTGLSAVPGGRSRGAPQAAYADAKRADN